jgi:hypothetical protein
MGYTRSVFADGLFSEELLEMLIQGGLFNDVSVCL